MATFNHVVGSFIYGYHQGVLLNNPIFSNLGLCAACFMCHHELWPTSVSHPFSLNSSIGLLGGKHYQKITIAYLWTYSSKFCYSRLLSLYSFLSLSFLLTFFWLVCYCSLWVFRTIVNWCRVAISNDKSTEWVPSLFCVSFLVSFFLK